MNSQATPILREVSAASALTADEITRLEQLHNAAFGPEERQYTADFIVQNAGRNGYRLFLASVDDRVIGYLFCQSRPERLVGYLWYMAVDESRRGRGIGTKLVRHALDRVRRDAPELRLVLLESHRPRAKETAIGFNRRRIEFYRRLGAHHVTGINYGLPAADDPSQLIYYEILFFPLNGAVEAEQVRRAIEDMMRNNFEDGDERVKPMLESLNHLEIDAPGATRR